MKDYRTWWEIGDRVDSELCDIWFSKSQGLQGHDVEKNYAGIIEQLWAIREGLA